MQEVSIAVLRFSHVVYYYHYCFNYQNEVVVVVAVVIVEVKCPFFMIICELEISIQRSTYMLISGIYDYS